MCKTTKRGTVAKIEMPKLHREVAWWLSFFLSFLLSFFLSVFLSFCLSFTGAGSYPISHTDHHYRQWQSPHGTTSRHLRPKGIWKRIPLDDNAVIGGIPPLRKRTDRRICHRKTQSCYRRTGNRNTTPASRAISKETLPGRPINTTTEPYGRHPTWKELRGEVSAFRENTNYDSDQEDARQKSNVRKSKQTSYEKRQETRRQEKNHSCVLRKTVAFCRTQGLKIHNREWQFKYVTPHIKTYHKDNLRATKCKNQNPGDFLRYTNSQT